MAKAYKCDLCRKFIDNCYGVSGLDTYPNELKKMGINKDERHEVKELCDDCYEAIRNVAIEIFKKSQSLATE